MAAIEFTNIVKQYDDITALQDFSLSVQEGDIYGFLGPNGAGKSTAINILLDFIRPTAGSIQVLGRDTREKRQHVRKRIGVVPEGFSTYNRLTGRQHLEFAISSKRVDDDAELLAQRVGIEDALDRRAGGYSKGMAQRLVLAMALVGEPDLLILDEPSTGLDPNGARQMREIVREENSRGATVFFSSHILAQVESVCDRVGILHNGEIVAEDTIEGLRRATQSRATLHIDVEHLRDDSLARVREVSGVFEAVSDGSSITVLCDDEAKSEALTTLEEAGVRIRDFSTEDASLDELFRFYVSDEVEHPTKNLAGVRA